MHRSSISSGNDYEIVPSACFDGKMNSPIFRGSFKSFQLQSNRRSSEAGRPHSSVPDLGTSTPSQKCVRKYSSAQFPSSTVELGPDDIEASYTRTISTGWPYSSRGNIEREGGEGRSSLSNICSSQENFVTVSTTADGDVSSSTPDGNSNNAYLIRSRRASFCANASPTNKTTVVTTSESQTKQNVTSYSILESILLNRNVPPFYSSLTSSGRRQSSNTHTEGLRSSDSSYERIRLHSLPLISVIPPGNLQNGHSQQRAHLPHWLPSREDDLETPLCLAFKRRKVSLEDSGCISENEISSAKILESDFRESNSFKPARKGSLNRPLLHSLLTFNSESDRQDCEEHLENMDTSQSLTSEPEVNDRNLDRTVCHVDSTDSLPTLEKLALADRSRQLSLRPPRVVIAKKMQLVVNRKVRKWLTEIAQLAAKYHDLTDLPREDWIVLLRNAVSRLLLLYMAENNFQFAVTPTSTEVSTTTVREDGGMVVPAEVPTAASVEDIQRFIAKCQALNVDNKEYHCMRLITLFHSGRTNGIKRFALVERINSGACKILQDLVRLSRPGDKLRYGELLLHLHTLASVNSRMVQRLFCIMPGGRDGNYIQLDESQWLMRYDV